MISKQEGGTDRGRAAAPGGTGGLGSEKSHPPPSPALYGSLCPGGELLLPGSGAPELPGDRRGAGGGGDSAK